MESKRKARKEKTRGEVCLNCEARIDTRYCPHCGQENVHGDHSVGVLARDFLTEIAYYDSKVWLTLRTMLTHPGRLSVEWAQGRRMKYVSPIKLYLWITFIFFFGMAFRSSTGPPQAAISQTSSRLDAKLDSGLGKALDKPGWESNLAQKLKVALSSDRKTFAATMQEEFPKVLFVLLPVLALVLKLMYWRQRKYYVDSLVFVLHLHSCYFAVLLLSFIIPPGAGHFSPVLATVTAIITLLLFGWMIAYTFVALLRFYGQPWWMTSIKSVVLGFAYSVLIFVGLVAAILVAVNSLPAKSTKAAPQAQGSSDAS